MFSRIISIICLIGAFYVPSISYAKTVKLGNFVVYEGEYDKRGIGAHGPGTLTMKDNIETTSQNMSCNKQRSGAPSRPIPSTVQDILTGTFEGNKVTNAQLTFGFGENSFRGEDEERVYTLLRFPQ